MDLGSNPRLVKLSESFHIKPFCSSNPAIDSHLFNSAKIYQQHLLSVHYVLENDIESIAFYALSNDLLQIDSGSSSQRTFRGFIKKNISDQIKYELLNWPTFPAVKLDFIAVNTKYQRSGIGGKLLEAIIGNFRENNKTGCLFLTASVLNNLATVNFYKKNNFVFLTSQDQTDESRIMYRSIL